MLGPSLFLWTASREHATPGAPVPRHLGANGTDNAHEGSMGAGENGLRHSSRITAIVNVGIRIFPGHTTETSAGPALREGRGRENAYFTKGGRRSPSCGC